MSIFSLLLVCFLIIIYMIGSNKILSNSKINNFMNSRKLKTKYNTILYAQKPKRGIYGPQI